MNKFLLILICVHLSLITLHCLAQPQAWNWYFGIQAAVNFSSGSPVIINGSAMVDAEGCASISDGFGNLLFYTEGISVWNRNNIQMPNGFGLNGNGSTSQSALIIAKPDSPNIYYIFTADYQAHPNGICYSVVDMTLDAGLGDVTNVKNIQLLTPACEKLCGVKHCNGMDYWVIVHGVGDSTFYSYLLSSSGISAPVLSNVGTNILNYSGNWTETQGYLKVSPNGKKIAEAIVENIYQVQLFDFDNATGILTNPIKIPFTPDTPFVACPGPYGISFSPDNLKLYVNDVYSDFTNTSKIFQYDISSNNQNAIIASQFLLNDTIQLLGALQLGIDGKIYVICSDSNFLNVINFPNILGAGCNYVTNAINLGSGIGYAGLPNMIDAYMVPAPATHVTVDTIYCATTYLLNPTDTGSNYLWSTGATTQNIPVTTNGTYWVQIQNAGGCNVQVNFMDTFHITLIPPVTVSLGQDTSICGVHSLILNAVSSGNSFSWSTGETTQSITVYATGYYGVTVTSSNGCSATAVEVVTVNSNPIPVITGDSSICSNDFSSLDAGTFAQYNWSTGASTETITVNTTNNYVVTVSNSSGCTGTASKGVTVYPIADASFTATDTIGCPPLVVNYINSSTNAISYLWNFGNNATSSATNPSFNYDSSGIYTITLIAYGAGGCNDTMTRSNYISIDTIPVVRSHFTASLLSGCNPLTVTFNNTSTNGINYLWHFGDGNISNASNPTYTYTIPGTYFVKLVAMNPSVCGLVQDSIVDTITVYAQAIASFTATDTVGCSPLNVSFINTSTNASSYFWNFGNNATSSTTNPSFYYDSSGIYTITLIAYGAGGCNDTVVRSNYISIDTLPTVHSSFTSIPDSGCSPVTITFNNTSSNGITCLWYFGDGDTSTVNSPIHSYIDSGTFIVMLISINNSSLCGMVMDTMIKTIRVNLTPTAAFTADTLTGCFPLTVTFNNNSSNATSYLWNFGNAANSVATSPSYIYDSSGIYTITLIAYGQGGCTDTMIKQNLITILGLPVISGSFFADSQRGCSPFTVNFTNTSNNGESYLWNFGDGGTDTAKNPVHAYLDSGIFTITLIITSTNTCGTTTDTITYPDYIAVNQFNPVAAFTSNYTTPIYTGDSIHFQNQSYDLYGSITLWQWWFSDGTGTNFINPIHQWNVPGMYQVELIVTDNKGCKDSVLYDYIDVIEGIIEIPNTFTPNNDGYNDFFEIKASGLETYQLEIFNRWGMKLFTSNSINTSWDGYNQNGLQCPDGTYYYVLKATGYTGANYNKAGFVMLLR